MDSVQQEGKPILSSNPQTKTIEETTLLKSQKGLSTDLLKLENAEELRLFKNQHKIWGNPLLLACEMGHLTIEDFKFLFSQYYYYSKNFTKLLAAGMVNCDSDYYRSRLSENLWEEGGGKNIELRHAEIFRKFLVNHLGISLDDIQFETYTVYFFKQYLQLCLTSSHMECLAILSFATEGIVARLYSILKQGLLKAGLTDDMLTFFNIHILCDDDHALTLEEMALSYIKEEGWSERCRKSINYALDLRDEFFTNLYKHIRFSHLEDLVKVIDQPLLAVKSNLSQQLKSDIHSVGIRLYQNEDLTQGIKFTVDRMPFHADVLDPRIVHIPPGYCNELHSHAHETLFLILEGIGNVVVDENIIPVKEGDIVYVPRWAKHQTQNSGKQTLKFFAVTDYGLTGRLPQNTESIYRQNPEKSFSVPSDI